MAILKPGSQAYADAMNNLKQSGGISGTQAKWKPTTTDQSSSSSYGGNASLFAAYQQQLADAQRRAEEATAKKQQLAQNAYDNVY